MKSWLKGPTGVLVALAAIWIKCDSRGPVFFRQERCGEKGRAFNLYKLRTMREDAEADTGPVWASAWIAATRTVPPISSTRSCSCPGGSHPPRLANPIPRVSRSAIAL